MCGLASVGDWARVRDADLADLVDELERHWAQVVIVVGPVLEAPVHHGADRFGASRAAIARADRLVGVCAPSRLGVLRCLDWLAEARRLAPQRPATVVVNGASRSGFSRAELEGQLREHAAAEVIADVVFLPADDRVRRAAWDGSLVGAGPFVRAVEDLATAVAPAAPAARRRRPSLRGRR